MGFFRGIGKYALLLALSCPGVALANGPFLGSSPMGTQTKKSLDLTKIALHFDTLFPSRSSIEFERILYQTKNPSGRIVEVSGLLIIPTETTATSFPLISYQHGTSFGNSETPSASTSYPETLATAIVFGSMGYLVAMPDYIGRGVNMESHPYLDLSTEASTSTDLLKAVDQYLATRGILRNGRLYLVGFSEGGHATLSLQKALEEGDGEFPVAGTAAIAGPYDLSGVTWKTLLMSGSGFDSAYGSANASALIYSMDQLHPFTSNLDEVFKNPLGSQIPEIFSGKETSDEVEKLFPPKLQDVLQPNFWNSLQKSPNPPLRQALALNDIYNWAPKAPILFLHASGDDRVPYQNSVVAYEAMRARGSKVNLTDLGANLGHDDCFVPAMIEAFDFIDKLNTTSSPNSDR
jgi:pimeloyl-ACP methyl ester carboxylesterase